MENNCKNNLNWQDFKDSISRFNARIVEGSQKHPILDAMTKQTLAGIPIYGNLLLELYDKNPGSEEDKTHQIYQLLQNMQQMNDEKLDQLSIELKKLKENGDYKIKTDDLDSLIKENKKTLSQKKLLLEQKLESLKIQENINNVIEREDTSDENKDMLSAILAESFEKLEGGISSTHQGIKRIETDREKEKKNQKVYLIVGIFASAILGSILGGFIGQFF